MASASTCSSATSASTRSAGTAPCSGPVSCRPRALGTGGGPPRSPVLHDGRLYLVVDNEEQSYLAALSAETGAEVWRTDREEGSNWSTPFVWEHAERTEIVTTGTDRIAPTTSTATCCGALGMSSLVIPTPITAHGLLYLESGYLGDFFRPVYAIRPGPRATSRWRRGSRRTSSWRGPSSRGVVPPVAARLRRPLLHAARSWPDDLSRRSDRGRGLRAAAHRRGAGVHRVALGLQRQDLRPERAGHHLVIEAGPEFRVVAENPLDEFTMATPAILDDSLIIRTAEAVYRIAER